MANDSRRWWLLLMALALNGAFSVVAWSSASAGTDLPGAICDRPKLITMFLIPALLCSLISVLLSMTAIREGTRRSNAIVTLCITLGLLGWQATLAGQAVAEARINDTPGSPCR